MAPATGQYVAGAAVGTRLGCVSGSTRTVIFLRHDDQ
jgi:hypothetical protein